MKNFISLLIIIPTAISILLFTVAAFAYKAPEMLVAAENPVMAICCIVGGIISAMPIFVSIVIWIINIFFKKK